MRWPLPLSSLLVAAFLCLKLSLALPLLARVEFELVPRIKGATHLNDIPSDTYRETAMSTSIQINADGTKTRLETAEERKTHGEAKFNAESPLEADHGLEKQQIPSFLKTNKLGTFDSLRKATRERVNKVMNHANNFAWIPKGLNSSKKHAVEQAMNGNQVSTDYPNRTSYLKSIYNRVKRTAQAVQKAVLKDPKQKEKWDKLDNPQDFDRINRQHYEAMGILKPGEASPPSTPGHTPYSSRPPSTIGGAAGQPGNSPSGSSPSLQLPQAGGSTNLGKHSRSDSTGSSSSEKVTKKAKEGSPARSSTSSSPGNKFAGLPKLNTDLAKSSSSSPKSSQSTRSSPLGSTKKSLAGLPKLNTNVMNSPSPRSKSPKSTSGRTSALPGKSVGGKEKGGQQARKTASPRSAQASARKSPTSPKSRGALLRSTRSAKSNSPGSTKTSAGLPKLNANVKKSTPPRPKSLKSASGRASALSGKSVQGKGKGRPPTRKSTNPTTSPKSSQSKGSKSPQSAKASPPGSAKNKLSGLPKLNTNVMKTTSSRSKSPKLASGRSSTLLGGRVGDKQKARQPTRKSTGATSPKSPQSARSSTPGSAKIKSAGLPKLNTKVVKSSSPRPKSPKSASGRARALPAKTAGGKARQQTPKSASPRTAQANVRKSPPSPKSRGASPKSPSPKSSSRSPIRGGSAAKPKVVLPKRAAKRGGKS